MYYAVLRKEIKMPCSGGELTLKVGGVYQLEFDDTYTTVSYRTIDLMEAEPEPYGPWYKMTVAQGREHFAQSYIDLNSAIEASFLVCEAAYC